MTPHQRFLATMRFQPVDRPPLWEWGPWPSALQRWQREAGAQWASPPQYAECDARALCGVDLWMRPRFEAKVLAEDAETIVRRNDRGIVERILRGPEGISMPEHLEYPVKTRRDWEELQRRFAPADPGRFPADWAARCTAWRESGPVLIFQGPRSPSLFGFVRELLGVERALFAFYDEPDLVHSMMDTITELTLALLERASAEAPLSALFFWEDMSYNHGPLISPAMFREFMIPRYRQITALARRRGLDTIFVDSDGNVAELLPLWLEAGLNGVYPFEVAAGMDVVALRRQYGRALLMSGGIDKRVLVPGPRAIDAELERKLPLALEGGYIPTIDHSIPHDVPYANFCYYWQRKKELLGIG